MRQYYVVLLYDCHSSKRNAPPREGKEAVRNPGALREERRAELQGDFLEQSRVLKLDPIVEDGDMDWRATLGIVTVHHDVDDCLAIVRLSLPLYHPA